nr:ABC-F family ATP-binding cassette domain-containing protein [Acidaminobacter sp. JC074]
MDFFYGEYFNPIFESVNLNLDLTWKLGLIGRNGRGKTTLLNLIHGSLEPTRGKVVVPIQTEMFPYAHDATGTCLDVIRRCIAPFDEWEKLMHELEDHMTEASMETYGDILEAYMEADGFIINELIEKEMNLMGLRLDLLELPFEDLSGGEKTKVQIIALFLKKNRFLLLDEPTNHLDLEGRQTLSNYLNHKSGFIVVSHDRLFVDAIVDHILSINKNNIYIEKGGYTSWQVNKDRQDYYEYKTSEKLKREIKNLEEATKRTRTWSDNKEAEKIGSGGDKGYIGARAKGMMKRALAFEKRMNQNLEEKKTLLKNMETPRDIILKQGEIDIETLVEVKNVSLSYGNHRVIENLSFRINKGDRIWVRGINGSGKTTLIKALLGDLKPESGSVQVHEGVKLVYSSQIPRWQSGYLLDHMKDEGILRHWFQMVLNYLDIDDSYYDRPIESFSEGEKKKIDIARSLMGNDHVLVWDEPLNYVDITIRTQIEKAILKYQPTMIFVEHDVYFGQHIATDTIDL